MDIEVDGTRPLVDRAYLARLERHIGRTALAELMDDALIELADRRGRLTAHLAANSATAAQDGTQDRTQDGAQEAAEGASATTAFLTAEAHDLIALAGHLGLSALSSAATELQRATRTEEAEHREHAIDVARQVAAMIDRSLDALATHRGSA
ncbi:MAG: hypothetical protein AAFS07_13085 [Pseudomonadota bacterium]